MNDRVSQVVDNALAWAVAAVALLLACYALWESERWCRGRRNIMATPWQTPTRQGREGERS